MSIRAFGLYVESTDIIRAIRFVVEAVRSVIQQKLRGLGNYKTERLITNITDIDKIILTM